MWAMMSRLSAGGVCLLLVLCEFKKQKELTVLHGSGDLSLSVRDRLGGA